jgi:hypothetical protein
MDINTIDNEVSTLKRQMSELRARYEAATTPWLQNSVDVRSRSAVLHGTKNREAPDMARLQVLKQEIVELRPRLPETVDKLFRVYGNRIWPQINESPGKTDYSILNNTLRLALGVLAPILAKHGLRPEAEQTSGGWSWSGHVAEDATLEQFRKEYDSLAERCASLLKQKESFLNAKATEELGKKWDAL